MTRLTPAAIVLAALILGTAIVAAQFVAPYRISGGYRLNAVSGQVVIATPGAQ